MVSDFKHVSLIIVDTFLLKSIYYQFYGRAIEEFNAYG